ncbi:hypothetical protein [Streptomyces sp. NPDC096339]|uniref:hypothetical protein n=1 Tax=Streptomyces sp. NPDC096339 TaxID=3366086 RepID=UPI0037FF5605
MTGSGFLASFLVTGRLHGIGIGAALGAVDPLARGGARETPGRRRTPAPADERDRSPIRYTMAAIDGTTAIACGEPVSSEARENALVRDRQRITDEKRTAALRPSYPPLIRC